MLRKQLIRLKKDEKKKKNYRPNLEELRMSMKKSSKVKRVEFLIRVH